MRPNALFTRHDRSDWSVRNRPRCAWPSKRLRASEPPIGTGKDFYGTGLQMLFLGNCEKRLCSGSPIVCIPELFRIRSPATYPVNSISPSRSEHKSGLLQPRTLRQLKSSVAQVPPYRLLCIGGILAHLIGVRIALRGSFLSPLTLTLSPKGRGNNGIYLFLLSCWRWDALLASRSSPSPAGDGMLCYPSLFPLSLRERAGVRALSLQKSSVYKAPRPFPSEPVNSVSSSRSVSKLGFLETRTPRQPKNHSTQCTMQPTGL